MQIDCYIDQLLTPYRSPPPLIHDLVKYMWLENIENYALFPFKLSQTLCKFKTFCLNDLSWIWLLNKDVNMGGHNGDRGR